MHSYDCTVPIAFEVPWAELVLNYCFRYSMTAHFPWNKNRIPWQLIFHSFSVSHISLLILLHPRIANQAWWKASFVVALSTKLVSVHLHLLLPMRTVRYSACTVHKSKNLIAHIPYQGLHGLNNMKHSFFLQKARIMRCSNFQNASPKFAEM